MQFAGTFKNCFRVRQLHGIGNAEVHSRLVGMIVQTMSAYWAAALPDHLRLDINLRS
jgi:hypothetical protein